MVTGQDRLMVLAVHPDDETLGTGGLLQQAVAAGAAVRVIFITDGDNNPWPQRFLERRWRIGPEERQRWGLRRRREALAALHILGIEPEQASFLGFPDQGVTSLLEHGNQRLVAHLCAEIASWRPSLLATPSLHDLHPDHNALAVLLEIALMQLPAANWRPQVLSYLIHYLTTSTPATSLIELSSEQLTKKRRALLCHETQTALSEKRFMRHVTSTESYSGSASTGRFQLFHPVQEVRMVDGGLFVRTRLPRWLCWAARPTLLLAVPNGACWRMELVDWEKCQDVQDATYDRVKGPKITAGPGMFELIFPSRMLANAEEIYIKLELRWGLYDYAGWRRASLIRSRDKLGVVGIIPCYNVEFFCEQVILQAVQFVDRLIVIDDGSSDGTSAILLRLATSMPDKIHLIPFAENRGKGVGLIAGFCEALNRYDFGALVTLDADGQHPPMDIPRITQQVQAGADMVIGEREIALMPGRSKFGNSFISAALRLLYSKSPVDTQSGMRGFSQIFAEEIVSKVRGSRYETEFQILLLALSQRRKVSSVPIATIYIDNNSSSKYRPIKDSVRILSALIRWQYGQCLDRFVKVSR